MFCIPNLSIHNIIKANTPIYMLGAYSNTSKRLYRILAEHKVRLTSIWDEQRDNKAHSNKHISLNEEYRKAGYIIEPIPQNITRMPEGILLVADEERFQRKWLNYCVDSAHTVYDAQDVILWPTYNRCASNNSDCPDLLKYCRGCKASYRSCPVRVNWYQKRYGEKRKKTLRHLAAKIGYVCNLKCNFCCEFLPMMNETQVNKFSVEQVVSDIKKLSMSLEYINLLSLSGGDVMLNNGLAEAINYIAALENIGSIYTLTNGTYVPHRDILNVIAENRDRIRIVINNYSINNNAIMLAAELEKRNIVYQLRDNTGWYDLNNLSYKNRSVDELINLNQSCSFDKNEGHYYIILNGKLNLRCGVANSILNFLDKYGEQTDDYIDIRTLSHSEVPDALAMLESREYLGICNYCTGCSEKNRTIIPALDQLSR